MSTSKSRILSIDPGESTGIAYLEDGKFIWGMVCRPESFDSNNFTISLIKMTHPTTIVIEAPPTHTIHYNADQYRIFENLKRFYEVAGYHVVLMSPGQWKKLTARTQIDSTHIRDAADMAKIAYGREEREHNGRP